jgi:flavin-dependent dehydrogenase
LHAIKSGQIAATCLAAGAAGEYTTRIHAQFAANFDAAANLSRFFYQWSSLVYKHGVKRRDATRIAMRLLAGDALFTDMAGRAMRRIRKAMLGEGRRIRMKDVG